ncbi:MAG: family 10 glycosylhydrolase [Bacteroidetes bacterium]|nr:family 10 glycosylhydrolase [Bacteroidota bacterium]
MVRELFRLSLALFLALLIQGCSSYSDTSQGSGGSGGAPPPPATERTGVPAVRGVWLTNVDSKVLNSREGIKEAVTLCKKLGINTIFSVVWNKGFTLYPSKVMKNTFGIEIDTALTGRDPLKELIEEAHAQNIKVFAWFEFGFASSFKLGGGHLLQAKPEWASKDKQGNLTMKNGFEWMNGFHPDVQSFMLSLIAEVVANYEVDGIQGDDRLPAMPSEAGYDIYTTNLYKQQNNGALPPEDSKNEKWVQWRANILTEFGGKIFKTVKAINPKCIVSMSPSIYPWSKEEYLQDWPEWVLRGYVELLCPQVYRYKIEEYSSTLSEAYLTWLPKGYENIFFPGVLIKVGGYQPTDELFVQMIEENRKLGIQGEVFFFYEGIKKYSDLLKNEIYTERVDFPKLLK